MTKDEQSQDDRLLRFAGLSGDLTGTADHRPPLVLLHGLTFDRSMWNATLAELSRLDPGRQTLALDLPGHGRSDRADLYGMDVVVDLVQQAIEAAGLTSPVMVGHSLSAIIATIYATKHCASGVVNVDQSLQTDQFSGFLRSMDERLRGPDFPAIWGGFLSSMHLERLSPDAQELLHATSTPQQDLVLGYWNEVLTRSPAEMNEMAAASQEFLKEADMPYMYVAGEEPDAQERAWLLERLPRTTIEVLPGSGHFPQLAHPEEFAHCLLATGGWPRRG